MLLSLVEVDYCLKSVFSLLKTGFKVLINQQTLVIEDVNAGVFYYFPETCIFLILVEIVLLGGRLNNLHLFHIVVFQTREHFFLRFEPLGQIGNTGRILFEENRAIVVSFDGLQSNFMGFCM